MKKLTTEDFITKSNIKHNNIYDYSKTIYKTAIEYNGLAYHHSTDHVNTFLDKTKKPIDYHLNKYTICLNNNINLIHIFEFEDLSIWRDLIKNFIINPELYTINFSNTLRVIKDLNVYGLSGISNKL